MWTNKLFEYDHNLRKKYPKILGLDEVGRGCVVGPLIVVGLILKPNYFNSEIKDSKKIKSISKRKILKNEIIENSLFVEAIVFNSHQIDKFNPKQCSKMGMQKISEKLINHFDIVVTDYEKIESLKIKQINLTKGDNLSYTIAAASIVAKSLRDDYLIELDKKYPEYMFIKNQGYLTKQHKNAIEKYGLIPNIYRQSYLPIKSFVLKKSFK